MMHRRVLTLLVMMLPLLCGAASPVLESPKMWRYPTGVYLNYALQSSFDNDMVRTAEGEQHSMYSLNNRLTLGYRPSAKAGTFIQIPVYYDNTRTDAGRLYEFGGAGDITFGGELFWSDTSDVFRIGATLAMTVPSGSNAFTPNQRSFVSHAFSYSAERAVVHPMLLSEIDFSRQYDDVPLALRFCLGSHLAFDHTAARELGDFTAGLTFGSDSSPVIVFSDVRALFSKDLFSGDFAWGEFPARVRNGISMQTANKNTLDIAVLSGINKDRYLNTSEKAYGSVSSIDVKGVPDFAFEISYTARIRRDTSKEAVLRKTPDSAPTPESADRDADGVADSRDSCPDEAGPVDNNGCPVDDRDGDGIVDSLDECPDEPEDYDGFEDEDGCPDLDNDLDGIVDSLDECPDEPEDYDGFKDGDGCPDRDNDGDGVADIDDMYPNDSSRHHSDENLPLAFTEGDTLQPIILQGITFQQGSTDLAPASFAVIDPFISFLQSHPEASLVIRGYTDATGSYDRNLYLSEKRAEAVRAYLLKWGIAGERLLVEAFGPANPVADNRIPLGRMKNRRIEFLLFRS
ncbi:MAG: OmpA family protein [Fibrobacterota bacterium]